jgi:hypothetical protein
MILTVGLEYELDSTDERGVEALMAKNPKVTTAAELDAMPPAERQQHFDDSIVRPGSLTDDERRKLFERLERVADSNRGGQAQRAS